MEGLRHRLALNTEQLHTFGLFPIGDATPDDSK